MAWGRLPAGAQVPTKSSLTVCLESGECLLSARHAAARTDPWRAAMGRAVPQARRAAMATCCTPEARRAAMGGPAAPQARGASMESAVPQPSPAMGSWGSLGSSAVPQARRAAMGPDAVPQASAVIIGPAARGTKCAAGQVRQATPSGSSPCVA